MDSGVDDDEWQPGEEDYRSEPQSTADAAVAAAAAVAAVGRRRAHQDTSGLIMLGKRRRGRQRQQDSDDEDYDELYGDDDEVKGEAARWQLDMSIRRDMPCGWLWLVWLYDPATGVPGPGVSSQCCAT